MHCVRKAAFLVACLLVLRITAEAADRTVTNANNHGAGSLRQAMIDVPAGGTIDFEPFFFGVPRTIQLQTGFPNGGSLRTTKAMTIIGPGPTLLTVRGTDTFVIFDTTDDNVSISGMTLTNGEGEDFGDVAGGIISRSALLTVNNCVFTGNRGLFAGGIYSQGTLVVTNSTFTNNLSRVPVMSGGGFSGAGGINNDGGMTLVNCTFSGNFNITRGQSAGAICQFNGASTITNCTITNNSCTGRRESGGGIRRTQGTMVLKNTIVADNVNNTSMPDIDADPGGITSAGGNIIGNIGRVTGFNQPGDRVGTGAAPFKPKLTPLGSWGGTTPTHLIGGNGPELDTGINPGAPADDQRGVLRPVNAITDVGAVEAKIAVTPLSIGGAQLYAAYTPVTFSASGGTAGYTWSVIGALPTGMALTGDTLSGTPTEGGSFPIIIVATDSTGLAGATFLTLVVTGQFDLVADLSHTGDFTQGQTGVQYTVSVTNTGTGLSGNVITATMTMPGGMTATSFGGGAWVQTSLTPPTATLTGGLAASANTSLTLTANVANNAGTLLTPTIVVTCGGEPTPANNTDSDPTTILSNQAPTITGALAGQAVNDNSTIQPFGAVTVGDVNVPAQSLTLTVIQFNTAKGTITPASVTASGFTDTGGGVYTFGGTAAQATTAIRQLVFAPTANRVAVGQTETTSFRVKVNDGIAPQVVNNTTTVVSTSINDTPTIIGVTAGHTVNEHQTVAVFPAVTIGDVDYPTQNLAVSVTLDTAAKGTFTNASLTAAGFTNAGGGVYEFTGKAAIATDSIRRLVFVPAPNRVPIGSTDTTTLTITVNDGFTGVASNNVTTVVATSGNDATEITGVAAAQTINDNQTINPFAAVSIVDGDTPSQQIEVAITLDLADNGAFSAPSLTASGFTDMGGGVYEFTGSAAAATTGIRQLVFVPGANRVAVGATETTRFTIDASDGVGASANDNLTTVVVTSANDAPSVTGAQAGQTITDLQTVAPFMGVTIADVDLLAQVSVSVTLDNAAKGSFTAASLTLSGFIAAGGGVYNFTGISTAATAAIRKLVFTPTVNRAAPGAAETTTFTIAANDGAAPAVTNATTTVISNSVNDPLANLQVSAGAPAIDENQTVTVNGTFTDIDAQDTHTVTIDWGDGSTPTVLNLSAGTFAFSVPHQYKDNPTGAPQGSYNISVEAADLGLAQVDANCSVQVNNVAPQATINGASQSVETATAIALTSTVADPGTLDSFRYKWTVTRGGAQYATGQSAGFTFTPDDAGTYVVTLDITDAAIDLGPGNYSASATVTILSVTDPIVITSGPTATPAAAGVGQTVAFAAAGIGGLGTLTYSWDFGDGSAAAAGENASHAYAAAGIYTATVTINDTKTATTSAAVTVTVTAPQIGTGIDTDGDGFSDDFENEVGSSPTDGTNMPAAEIDPKPLTLSKAGLKLNFASSGGDSLSLAGVLPVAAGFKPADHKFTLIVGGVTRTWQLNIKGIGINAKGSVKLSIKAKKGVVAAQNAKFAVKVGRDTFAASLAGAGLTNADAKNARKNVLFTIVFQNSIYQKSQPFSYSARKDKGGMAKSLK